LHATLEVNKLREERRKLMDINNELRAATLQQVTPKAVTLFAFSIYSLMCPGMMLAFPAEAWEGEGSRRRTKRK
jgi:hypothetical protein